MSSVASLLAVGLLLFAGSAGGAQPARPRRAQGREVEQVVRLPPVAPGDWVPQMAPRGVYPRTWAAGAGYDRPPDARPAGVSGPRPDGRAGRADPAVYAPPVYGPCDGPAADAWSLGRWGTSAGYWTPAEPDRLHDAGPVFDGLDGPDEVSPAFGGTDTPGGSRAPCDRVEAAASLAPDGPPQGWFGRDGRLWAECHRFGHAVWCDHRHYYSWRPLCGMALGFAAGGILANTTLDQQFQDWYQDDVRSRGTDNLAAAFKTFGEGQLFIPAFAALAVLDFFCDDLPVLGTAGDFGNRATRAYLVGTPLMLVMQVGTGGSRPDEESYHSQWRPFHDANGVSGHAFVGAVPFLTAARMCHCFWLKAGFYILSTFTAWSRLNDNGHYLSQAWLGWWMAYMACLAVDETEQDQRLVALTPIATPEMTGVGIVLER